MITDGLSKLIQKKRYLPNMDFIYTYIRNYHNDFRNDTTHGLHC